MLRQLTRFSAYAVYIAVLSLYGFSLWALFHQRGEQTFWSWEQTAQLLKYSSLQALLSASLATLFGVLLARAFFYLPFSGKRLFYQIISFAWALPSLVVIFALIGVWGNGGWVAQGLAWFGADFSPSLYGLHGILLAHLFLNIPLVMKYSLEGLNLIPSSRHQLASQLGLNGLRYFHIVEWPMLKGILPYAFSTVFLLCFTSFPIVLMLGGNPKYSTLEVAIYQAVTFEFDFAKAVKLIGVQVIIGLFLQIVMDMTTRRTFERTLAQKSVVGTIWRSPPQGFARYASQGFLLFIGLMICVPMLNVVWHGVDALNGERLSNPQLWQSLLYSLVIALLSALCAIAIAYLIALETRQLAYQGRKLSHTLLAGISTYPLILPVFLLAVGLFLLLMEVELSNWQLLLLVGGCNGLMLLPFSYRLIFSAMWEVLIRQDKLARSLGLSGFQRWWIVEKNVLIRPLVHAFAVAMSAGLGHFAVIAFFGSPDFSTLPYLLYQQIGSYRLQEASLTALILLLCTLLPFLLIIPKEIR